jgi:hypothetical protein
MSDRDAKDLTIGPQAARQAPRRASSPTQTMKALQDEGLSRGAAAIAATHERREDAKADVDPTVMWKWGIIRNFLLGLPLFGLGLVLTTLAFLRLEKHLAPPNESIAPHDLLAFILPALLILAGVAFIAPGPVETCARFLGLGGIVDKLPFIKSKPASG